MSKILAPFYSRIIKTDKGCWEYQIGKSGRYCRIMVNYKVYGAHVYSWILTNGKIPRWLWVLHRCDNPPCINPKHLFLGNQSDNIIDCVLKGRHAATKLNPEKVKEIRKKIDFGEGIRKLGREFGVCHKTIYEIKKGIRWAHVK
jgi:hypothetical protein